MTTTIVITFAVGQLIGLFVGFEFGRAPVMED